MGRVTVTEDGCLCCGANWKRGAKFSFNLQRGFRRGKCSIAFQNVGGQFDAMRGSAEWERLRSYFEIMEAIRKLAADALDGSYGGPAPKTWSKRKVFFKEGDAVYVLSKEF